MLNYIQHIFIAIRRFQLFVVISSLFFSINQMDAQVTNSVLLSPKPTITDSIIVKYHSPKKAALLSSIIPGLGQVYNKKYWKVPLFYLGFAGLAYSINGNQIKYVKYRNAYKYRIDGDPLTVDAFPLYSDDNLNTLQLYYNRYRNLSVIGVTLLYVINILDASVDAHMFTFDVGDDLSLQLNPTLINTSNFNSYISGLSVSLNF